MIELTKKSKILLFIFHVILGIVFFQFRFLSSYYGFLIVAMAIYFILILPDPKGLIPLFASAYIIGIEVLLRMAKASLFWEFGKYSILLFLLLGFVRKNKTSSIYFPIFFYFILLLPSIIQLPIGSINIWRQYIAFNLSGPACLFISAIYFYNTNLKKEEVQDVLLCALLPIISMGVFIMFKMPEFSTYRFLPYSDPNTSGGYGPNQVSTLLGFGIAVLLYGHFTTKKVFINKFVDLFIIIVLFGLGLLTFSRGGILASIISLTIAISIYIFYDQKNTQIIIKTFIILFMSVATWYAISIITDGIISQRYGLSGNSYAERMALDFTGRLEIYSIDLDIFSDYYFSGVGPGQAYHLREYYGYGKEVAAHTEYSRMLAEHGLLGLISLCFLIGIPLYYFFSSVKIETKFTWLLFVTLALLTFSHSAMRIAMPCFIYGLLFPKYKD